jgi:Icc protein
MEKRPAGVRLVQVSDCHVAADPETDYRGHSADHNLRRLLPAIRAWDPHRVLLTGDVSEDASDAAYARVAVMLGTVGAPILALPGNHDDPGVMRRHFGVGPWRGPCEERLGRWQLVLLDSTEKDRVSGILSQQSLERLDQCLRASTADHVLVALHHQPVPVGSPWIDQYALEEAGRFFEICDLDHRIRCIAWGHVHQDFRAERNGVSLLGAPSSVANSLPGRDRFTLDLAGPACRWLELLPDGRVQTGVFRVDQSSTGNNSQRIT